MNAGAAQDPRPAPPRRLRLRDRLLATTVAGPLGRGFSFCVELVAAIARGLRGVRQDPEERRY